MSRRSPRRAQVALFLVCCLLLTLVIPAGAAPAGLRAKPDPIRVAVVRCDDQTRGEIRDLDGVLERALTLKLADSPRFEVVSPDSGDAKWLVAAALSKAEVEKGGQVAVELQAQAQDAVTGELIARSVARADSGQPRQQVERGLLIRRAVDRAAERAVIQLAEAADVEATVIETQRTYYVRLDVGTRQRIYEGAEFKIFHRGEAVGRVRVMDSAGGDCEAKILELQPDKQIRTGDRAKLLFSPSPKKHKKRQGLSTAGKVLGGLLLAGALYLLFHKKGHGDRGIGPVVLVASPPSIAADGTSTTEVRGTIRDARGRLVVDNTLVDFSTTAGAITQNARTENGVVTATLTSDTTPTVATVTAEVGEQRGTIDVPFTGPAMSMALTATPVSIVADGAATSRVRAEVRDAAGNLVEDGTTVEFETTFGMLSGASAATINGVAEVDLISAQDAGTAIVTATVNGVSATVSVQFTAGTVTVALSSDRLSLPADGASQANITALVRDGANNPVPDGTEVRFATTLGTIPAMAITTGGTVTVKLTSDTAVGTATITASSMGVHGSLQIALVTAGASIILSSNVPWIPADGVSTMQITAEVKDALNNPAPDGTIVEFSTSLGRIIATATTTNGLATVTLTSAAVAGPAMITALALGTYANLTVEFRAGPGVVHVELVAANTVLAADGVSTTTITATVYDGGNNPLPAGTLVDFSTNLGTIGAQATTDANGQAVVTLRSSTTPGMATVQATAVGALPGQVTVLFVGPPNQVVVTANPTIIQADGTSTSTIAVLVTDINGNPVLDGTPVSLAASLGTIDPADATTTNGVVIATLTSELTDGPSTVTATADGVTGAVVVTFAGGAASIIVLANPDTITADGMSTSAITATVRDASNNPVPDGAVCFFSTTLGTIPQQAPTAGGVASVNLTSDVVGGTAVVTVTCLGVTGQVLVQTIGPPVVRISVAAGADTLPADGTSTTTITVTVRDANGDPVAGDTVTVMAPAGRNVLAANPGDPLGDTVVATTDLFGQARVLFTADTIAGAIAIRATAASAPGLEGQVSIMLAQLLITALTADPQEIVVGGFSSTISVTVQDGLGGNAPDGTVVDLAIINAAALNGVRLGMNPTATASAVTVNGIATTTLTSGTKAGVAQVGATLPVNGTGVTLDLVGIRADLPYGPPPMHEGIAVTLDPPSDTTLPWDDVTETLTVNALARDQFDNPVENGTPINFEIDPPGAAVVTGSALTNTAGSGIAQATVRSNGTVGPFTVVAFTAGAGGVRVWGRSPIIDVVGPPAAIFLSTPTLAPDFTGSERAAAGTDVDLSAFVVDVNGIVVTDGTPVQFNFVGQPPVVTTTTDGIATTTFASSTPLSVSITAHSPPLNPTATSNLITVIFVGDPTAFVIAMVPPGTTLDVDGVNAPASRTINITARDILGALALDGTAVNLTTGATTNGSTVTLTPTAPETLSGTASAVVAATAGPAWPATGTADVSVTGGPTQTFTTTDTP